MFTLILFGIFFSTLFLINKLMGDYLKVSFIGRICLIFFLGVNGLMRLVSALNMNSATEGVTEMGRNIVFFTAITEIILACGFVFLKSTRWVSGVFILILLVYAGLSFSSISLPAEVGMFGPTSDELSVKLLEYLMLIIWTSLFGIYLVNGDELIGWKGKGW